MALVADLRELIHLSRSQMTDREQDESLPPISVILAVRNEQEQLDRCLRSIAEQDYPDDRVEILVIDGMSSDRTPEIIESWRKADSRVRVFSNEKKIVPAGMNIGLQEARYDLVLWLSGHALLKPDHLRKSVLTMQEIGAAAVGGVLETVGVSATGRINAAVLSSRFGVGAAPHRVAARSGWVPAVTMALYRKKAITAAGGFNETLPRNQDNDLHYRMNRIGLKSYLDVGIRPTYLCRQTLFGLLRQAWGNGFWNIMLTRMGHSGLSLRHFVPLLFVAGLVCLGAGAAINGSMAMLFLILAAIYVLTAIISSVALGVRRKLGWRILIMPVWFPLLHLTYGLGSWAAIFSRRPNPTE
jgi:glycosyltransferase involved in cell wall biosynthesis